MKGQKKVLGVIRLSRDTEESTSPERQRQIIENWASVHECQIVGWAEDRGVSASVDPWKRPELGPWLHGQRTSFNTIVVWRVDRLARRVLHFASLLDWARNNHKDIVSATEGFDLATPLGRMFAQMIAMLAEGELEAVKERTKASYDYLIANGRHRGGFLPYGYRAQPNPAGGYRLEIDPDAAAVIQKIVQRILDGCSINSVVTWLNSTGVPTSLDHQRIRAGRPPKGALWRVGNLSKMLRSRTLLGYMQPDNRSPVVDDAGRQVRRADPILTYDQWQQLQDHVAEKRTRDPGQRQRSNGSMLLRVAFCGLCGRPLYVYPGRSSSYYRCASKAIGGISCGNRGIAVPRLEQLASDMFLGRIGDVDVVRKRLLPGEDHQQEIDETQAALERLIVRLEKMTPGGLAEEAVLARIREHEVRLTDLKNRPQRPDIWAHEATGQTISQLWDNLDRLARGKFLREAGVRIDWTPDSVRIDLGDLTDLPNRARQIAGNTPQ